MRSARLVNAAALGNILRTSRLQRGLGQRELAETLGISQRYVVEIERGKPTKALERIFDFMRETRVDLYAEVPDE